MKKFLPVFLVFLMVSCNSALKTYYGMNRNHAFTSNQEIVDFFEKKNNINPADLYFFEHYNDIQKVLGGNEQRLNRSHFCVALNDSLMVDDLKQANYYCVGLSANAISAYDTISSIVPNPFYKLGLKNINGEALAMNRDRPTVVLLVHSNMGSHLKSEVRYLKKETAKVGKEFNYVFIATDILAYRRVNWMQ